MMLTYESKATARIPTDLYDKIKAEFHYGQQTLFFNQVFKSLANMIDEGRFDEVRDYMYNGASLVLSPNNED